MSDSNAEIWRLRYEQLKATHRKEPETNDEISEEISRLTSKLARRIMGDPMKGVGARLNPQTGLMQFEPDIGL